MEIYSQHGEEEIVLKYIGEKTVCVESLVRGQEFSSNWEHLLLPFYDKVEFCVCNSFYLRK